MAAARAELGQTLDERARRRAQLQSEVVRLQVVHEATANGALVLDSDVDAALLRVQSHRDCNRIEPFARSVTKKPTPSRKQNKLHRPPGRTGGAWRPAFGVRFGDAERNGRVGLCADGPGKGASLFEPLAHENLIGLDAVSAALCLDMDTSIAAVWRRLNGR